MSLTADENTAFAVKVQMAADPNGVATITFSATSQKVVFQGGKTLTFDSGNYNVDQDLDIIVNAVGIFTINYTVETSWSNGRLRTGSFSVTTTEVTEPPSTLPLNNILTDTDYIDSDINGANGISLPEYNGLADGTMCWTDDTQLYVSADLIFPKREYYLKLIRWNSISNSELRVSDRQFLCTNYVSQPGTPYVSISPREGVRISPTVYLILSYKTESTDSSPYSAGSYKERVHVTALVRSGDTVSTFYYEETVFSTRVGGATVYNSSMRHVDGLGVTILLSGPTNYTIVVTADPTSGVVTISGRTTLTGTAPLWNGSRARLLILNGGMYYAEVNSPYFEKELIRREFAGGIPSATVVSYGPPEASINNIQAIIRVTDTVLAVAYKKGVDFKIVPFDTVSLTYGTPVVIPTLVSLQTEMFRGQYTDPTVDAGVLLARSSLPANGLASARITLNDTMIPANNTIDIGIPYVYVLPTGSALEDTSAPAPVIEDGSVWALALSQIDNPSAGSRRRRRVAFVAHTPLVLGLPGSISNPIQLARPQAIADIAFEDSGEDDGSVYFALTGLTTSFNRVNTDTPTTLTEFDLDISLYSDGTFKTLIDTDDNSWDGVLQARLDFGSTASVMFLRVTPKTAGWSSIHGFNIRLDETPEGAKARPYDVSSFPANITNLKYSDSEEADGKVYFNLGNFSDEIAIETSIPLLVDDSDTVLRLYDDYPDFTNQIDTDDNSGADSGHAKITYAGSSLPYGATVEIKTPPPGVDDGFNISIEVTSSSFACNGPGDTDSNAWYIYLHGYDFGSCGSTGGILQVSDALCSESDELFVQIAVQDDPSGFAGDLVIAFEDSNTFADLRVKYYGTTGSYSTELDSDSGAYPQIVIDPGSINQFDTLYFKILPDPFGSEVWTGSEEIHLCPDVF